MTLRGVTAVAALAALCARPVMAQTRVSDNRRSSLATADSLMRSGDSDAARHAYDAVLAANPANSRAVYQLGVLQRGTPEQALRYFVRYVSLEPGDPWGLMAVGDVLARLGRTGEAADWYARAEAIAPAERDAVVGHARVLGRARRSEEAIATFERWLRRHPRDTDVLIELAREQLRAGRAPDAVATWTRVAATAPQRSLGDGPARARAAAAPAIASDATASRDSDANDARTLRVGADLALGARARGGVRVTMGDVRDGLDVLGATEVAGTAVLRPAAHVRIETALGVTTLPGIPRATRDWIAPTGTFRLRWMAPGARVKGELAGRRELLRASPMSLESRVVRQDAKGMLELALAGPLRLRGTGRVGTLVDRYASNLRGELSAAVVVGVRDQVDVSLQGGWMGFANPSVSGYFAPRGVQTFQAQSYFEVEPATHWSIAADVSAGVQQVAGQDSDYNGWREALGLYGLIAWSPVPTVQFRLEVEAYDAAIAPNGLTTAGQWWSGSVGLGIKYSL